MGDIADMMLDGTCCSGCGEYLSTGPGHTRLCASCDESERADGATYAAAIEDFETEFDEPAAHKTLQAEYDALSAQSVLGRCPSLQKALAVLPEHNATGGLTVAEVATLLNIRDSVAKERLKRLRALGLAHSTGNGKPGRRSKENQNRWSKA